MLTQLQTQPRHSCQLCALPLTSNSDYCGQCLAHPPDFTHTLASFYYQFPLDYLIGRFKFERCLASTYWLGQAFEDYLRWHHARADLIVPVPMHWRGLVRRGLDQTLWLGRAASRASGAPVAPKQLQKTRHSEPLHGLSRKERAKSIRGIYRAQPLQGQHVALVDDIVTTTTTARTLSRLLCKAGAASVQIWALARTPEH